MKSTKIIALLLLVAMCFGVLTSCWGTEDKKCDHKYVDGKCTECGEVDPDYIYDDGTVSYNTYTSVMPSNWNELTYQDANDTQIMSYISSSFYGYDYKFDGGKYNADGSINFDGIVPGAYSTYYSAATKLEDVTSSVDAKWGYTDEQKAAGGYAWKITLRNDLKWDDGTPITAADFVYSMQQQLDPNFMNYRGNTYYDTLRIKDAKAYYFQNQEGAYETVGSLGFKSNAEAIDAGKVICVNMWDFYGAKGAPKITSFDETTFVPVLDFDNSCPNWVAYNDGTYYFDYAYFVESTTDENGDNAFVGEDGTIDFEAYLAYVNEYNAAVDASDEIPEDEKEDNYISISDYFFSGMMIYNAYNAAGYIAVGGPYASYVGIYVENTDRDVSWDRVGMFEVPGENAFIVCLDVSYSLLAEDGTLSVWAPYYMASLPLVHRTKYEANKHEPVEGASLWTSTYNSDLESTASWGPYKLVEFVAGSHYKLVKNEYWYGWNMDEYKNQYNIDAINCRNVKDPNTAWLGFLAGTYDNGGLTTDNYDEYKDSKYVTYELATGTFGMQLFSDLTTLKASQNNNGILAILEFRQALNLAIDRSDVVEKIWPGSTVPCFGLLNSMYFYDIENSPNLDDGGIYRNTDAAKAGILRAYGFTESNGKWSDGININNVTLDEAYEALTGYNLELAKQKMQDAIKILTENAEYYGYDATKNITLVYGSSVDNDKQRFRCQYLQDIVNELTKGTALEGKIVLKFDASAGDKWSDAFRNGDTQIGFGYGFQGNPFNPFDIIGAFVNPDDSLNYHEYWDTSAIEMTLTLPAGDYEGAGQTHTMSVQNWYYCLNGLATEYKQDKTFNWNAGFAPAEARLTILSALEELVLKESRSVMLIGDAGGSFLGAKFSYCNYEYNTFMGYGGMRYIQVNYTDVEWYKFVQANNSNLSNEYKKSE